jgi:glycosyltransferase involved in cell wall biosynthesis
VGDGALENDGSKSGAPKIISLTKYIPFTNITHAGGQYLLDHYRALSEIADVGIWSPDTPLNRDALKQTGVTEHSALLKSDPPKMAGFPFRFFQLESVLAGSSIYWPVRRLFRSDRAPWVDIERADIVEMQWSEMMSLAPAIRHRFPEKTLIGVAHDVITQRWAREAQSSTSLLRRSFARFARTLSRSRESRSFEALDVLIVFSEKDAVLAKQISPNTKIEVIRPGLGPKPLERTPNEASPIALFVGAMNRPENWKSALWFLQTIWPNVSGRLPKARVIIAGAKPPQRLLKVAAATPQAEITGFVDDLEAFYKTATVCVVPLLFGAGVKFKTLDAMLYGVPLVSTDVGIEGIDAAKEFVSVANDSASFAEATIKVLSEPDKDVAASAKEWADLHYGKKAFHKTIRNLYGSYFA